MAIKQVNPYLIFEGTADKAIGLYERALGAKTEGLMRYGDVPGQTKWTGDDARRVIHALLRIDGNAIMVSDAPPGMPIPREGNVHVSVDFETVEELGRAFDVLAQGGQVGEAPHDTFWGARFAMLTDAYGVRWMLNCQLKKG